MSERGRSLPHSGHRVVRIISRLNIGGPAIQAITLTRLLEPLGYETTLIRGIEGPSEGTMDDLARDYGVHPVLVSSLRRDVGPRDVLALVDVARRLRHLRPDIVHTHAAKAGTIGRMAALLVLRGRHRPVLVHTYHGHSLSGYFSSMSNAVFLRVERFLAKRTDRLIGVSSEVRDELVRLGVAGAERFEVVPVGFDLSRFAVDEPTRSARRSALRAELGIANDTPVVTLVARLVPIKRVDRFLRLAASLRDTTGAHFLIVGDGPMREKLQSSAAAHALGDRLVWAGFRRDMPDVFFASDVVVQTSDNEGTPVSLIEAQAAGVPVVSTGVGGVPSVLDAESGGRVVEPADELGLSRAVRDLLPKPTDNGERSAERRDRIIRAFSVDRLVEDLDGVYRNLLTRRHASRPPVKDHEAKLSR
jgi:glycosyltransferase involved in cell wall biosynthesis